MCLIKNFAHHVDGMIPSPSKGYTVPMDSPTPTVFRPSVKGSEFLGGLILTGRPTFFIISHFMFF
jgi:hypothetical protein